MKVKIATIFMLFVAVSCSESEPTIPDRWYTQTQVDLGKKTFQTNCVACHGNNAQGTANWKQTLPDKSYPPPPLNGTAHTWHHPMRILRSTIQNGGVPLGGKMPAFKDTLSDEEIDQVIAYIQSYWQPKVYNAWEQRGGLK